MPENQGQVRQIRRVIGRIMAIGEEALSGREKLDLLQAVRAIDEDAKVVDSLIVEATLGLDEKFQEAGRAIAKLRELVDGLTAPPWYPATLLGLADEGERVMALVGEGNHRRFVTLAESLDPCELEVGEGVYLSHERNVVLGRSARPLAPTGEVASLQRLIPDGRAVLLSHGEEIVVTASAALLAQDPQPGDPVSWNREQWICEESIAKSADSPCFLEETPQDSFEDIGGLDEQIEIIKRAVTLQLEHPELTTKYGVTRKGGILLSGPPGTGKTMLARALANYLAGSASSGRSHFMNVQPASLGSVYYSQTESNYREAFRVAREVGAADPGQPVIMFFDEVDAAGALRGESLAQVHDRVLATFLAELDGLTGRENVIVVAATNRPDALDPALLRPGRMGDIRLEIPRPNRAAAGAIFERHLPKGMPFRKLGPISSESGLRRATIESALSHIYAPNGLGVVAHLVFRDGSRMPVMPSKLISGAVIAKIAHDAAERACLRELETGQEGLSAEDLLDAVDSEFASSTRLLTPANCRGHLDEIPADTDVVRIELATRPELPSLRRARIA